MQKLFGKLNSKMAIIGTVSAIVVVLCIVGIVIGVNSKNNKSSNETENDKNVVVETTTVKETQTNKSTEGSKATELSTENVTEEAATEKASENVTEEAKAEENNVVENDASAGNNNSSNSQQKYNEPDTEAPATPSPEPSPEPDPEPSPSPEPSPEPDTPQEDHIVYKSDGSIDLNESYWVNRMDAYSAIYNSKEMNDFKNYINKKYNYNGGYVTHMNYGGRHSTWSVYDFIYFIVKSGNQDIDFYFNGSEFVEK